MSAALRRGSQGFRITSAGKLEDCAENAELLRQLWIGRESVSGDSLGPGDPGDFDFGAWHVSCHLVAAAGVIELDGGGLAWLEISDNASRDTYYPSVTVETHSALQTLPLNSQAPHEQLRHARALGFVEGTSLGRISARGIHDPDDRFNGNPRQEYDQEPESPLEGGKVWEHWCTLRDIRDSASIGLSVVGAYVTLCSHLGDLFAAVVARGRQGYGHPAQLAAMVEAGFIGVEAGSRVLRPSLIPPEVELLLKEARPEASWEGVSHLDWSDPPRYYMFSRSIGQWNPDSLPAATR